MQSFLSSSVLGVSHVSNQVAPDFLCIRSCLQRNKSHAMEQASLQDACEI
ncbi:hypothetical protein Plhal304r1_c086g0169601 [Plasmopara halstedii]